MRRLREDDIDYGWSCALCLLLFDIPCRYLSGDVVVSYIPSIACVRRCLNLLLLLQPNAGVMEYATTSSSLVLKHLHKFPMPSSKPGANTLLT